MKVSSKIFMALCQKVQKMKMKKKKNNRSKRKLNN